jgi:hypothetical protein
MYYKCLRCEHKEARGYLPTMNWARYMLLLMGCLTAIAFIAARSIHGDGPRQTIELEYWDLLLVPLTLFGLTGAAVGAMLLNYVFELVEYVAFLWKKCPRCGARRWSWGSPR